MAIESAIILARLLGEEEPSDQLFEKYLAIRHGRTDWVTTNSRRGISNVLGGGIWVLIRAIFFRFVAGYFFRSGFFGHYGYDAGTVPLQ